ncbi:hypothetical protein BCR37DRAFT_375403 [Protomyces lactucae-debilis]|uniref:Uncharacterized protein n=1 Tax=Protomyces lactucae-debilis TaxID=2754530 RepID=A0A1Y2FUC5_PROLT|nr:uncharacterized protein BCR37DRAFT_375403 [Protomyces lactucae-debilis]ORY87549.1 hypothetical protein BCR37DRAFT_375403 [Protomyces lactucae-debilis]
MSDPTFDLLPTLLTFTPRLLSSLVLAGLWRWVSSPFIIAGLFILSWLSSKVLPCTASTQARANPPSPVNRGRSGRPSDSLNSEEKIPQRSGSASGVSIHSVSDSDSSSGSSTDHRVAFPGLGRRTKHWQTMLGGPGGRRANLVNAAINLILFAAVLQRTQPLQVLFAEPGCFAVSTTAGTESMTLQTRMSLAPRCLQRIDPAKPLVLHVLAKDASDTHRDVVLDVSRLHEGKEEVVKHTGLSSGTAYRVHITQGTGLHYVGVARTALVDKRLPDGRCSLGLHASGDGLSTRERIHNLFGQTLCGPVGGKSLLYQMDVLKAYLQSKLR